MAAAISGAVMGWAATAPAGLGPGAAGGVGASPQVPPPVPALGHWAGGRGPHGRGKKEKHKAELQLPP